MPTNCTSSQANRTTDPPPGLSDAHRRMLEVGSGISPTISGGRPYQTVKRSEVPEAFADYQRRNGLLIPLYSPDGVTTGWQLRPDKPRRDKRGKPIKYETPTGAKIIADVHPRMLGAVADPSVPLWITEGVKCGDSLTSRGRCTLSLIGVWMYRTPGTTDMLPCFDHVALAGRRVFVVYDSDVMSKPEVAMALGRLVSDLSDRGARPLVVYLPDASEADGKKQGADDFLAAGGTVEAMEEMARPFAPSEATRERIHRDQSLRAQLAALWQLWREEDWPGIGGHTRREVLRAMIEDAARRGKRTPRGPLVPGALRPLAERTGVSVKAVRTALDRLQDMELIAEDKTPRPAHAGRFYVLLTPKPEEFARGIHKGKKDHRDSQEGPGQREAQAHGEYDHGVYPMQNHKSPANAEIMGEIKRLRWSYCARVYDEASGTHVHTYIQRVGKIDGRVVEALALRGGEAPISLLASLLGQRVYELRGRSLKRLQAAGLIVVEGERVSLAHDWPEKLGIARELGGEYRTERLKQQQHREGRKAYREHRAGKHKADRAPTQDEMDADPRRVARQQRQRLDVLIGHGMRADFASREVFGGDGFISDLVRDGRSQPEPEPPDGDDHPLDCECLGCSIPRPRYATPVAGGAA